MKCPNCNQEIIDNKDFCPNCGKILRKQKSELSVKAVIIIFSCLITLGIVICLSIMFLGTDKEIEPFVNRDDSNTVDKDKINYEDYYGDYKILSAKETFDTNEEISNIKDNFIGWNVEFKKEKVKFGLYGVEWYIINNPVINEVSTSDIKKLFTTTNEDILSVTAIGNNEISGLNNASVRFVIYKSKLYIYSNDMIFELEKATSKYIENNSFYNLNLLEKKYTTEIDSMISSINSNFKEIIESDNISVVKSDYNIIKDGNINHIITSITTGSPNGHVMSSISCITYNIKTFNVYNLKEYLDYKDINYDDIISEYNNQKELLLVENEEFINDVIDMNDNINYYVESDKLYIEYAVGFSGQLFVEIDL